MSSIEERIRRGLAADVSVSADDMIAAAAAGARRSRRQQQWAVGMGAAAAVITVVVGGLAVTTEGSDSQPPAGPPTPTDTTSPAEAAVNGRIQGIKDYLGDVRPACDGCFVDDGGYGVFDQDAGTVLFSAYPGISIVSPDGTLAELTCDEDVVCPRGGGQVVSGPGEDELTLWAPDQQLRVVGFDGSGRFTTDLLAGIPRGEDATHLAWSPEGDRLAVNTQESTGRSTTHRIWVVHRDGSEPQLVHTASDTGPDGGGPAKLLGPAVWHPDGTRLGFIEERGNGVPGSPDAWTRVVSLLVPAPGQREPGDATTLRAFDDWCACSRRIFLWAPDGTRVGIIEPKSVGGRAHVLELSAEDGTILAQHPLQDYPVIWPAGRP